MRRLRRCVTSAAEGAWEAGGREGRRRCNGLRVYARRRRQCMFSNEISVFRLENGMSGMRRVRGTRRTMPQEVGQRQSR